MVGWVGLPEEVVAGRRPDGRNLEVAGTVAAAAEEIAAGVEFAEVEGEDNWLDVLAKAVVVGVGSIAIEAIV